MLPTGKGRNPAVKTLQAMRDQGNCPGSVLTGIGWDLDKIQGAPERCDWAEKMPPVTNAKR